MTKRYYFCIRYTPVQADYELLAGRCISQMHLFMVNNRQAMNKIGVSFPDWSDVTVGQTIAFVADDKEMMIGLSFQPYYSLMVNGTSQFNDNINLTSGKTISIGGVPLATSTTTTNLQSTKQDLITIKNPTGSVPLMVGTNLYVLKANSPLPIASDSTNGVYTLSADITNPSSLTVSGYSTFNNNGQFEQSIVGGAFVDDSITVLLTSLSSSVFFDFFFFFLIGSVTTSESMWHK